MTDATFLTGHTQAFRGQIIFMQIKPFYELQCTLNCLTVFPEHCIPNRFKFKFNTEFGVFISCQL